MGMYTEIYINVNLRDDTPNEVIDTLQAICNGDDESPLLKDKPHRWLMLFDNGSIYTPCTSCKNLTWDKLKNQWSLLGKGDIKNYKSEIQTFFDWIMPYVDACVGEFIGYYKYEEALTPTLIYFKNTEVKS